MVVARSKMVLRIRVTVLLLGLTCMLCVFCEDLCRPENPCQNGGFCREDRARHRVNCDCPKGWLGMLCDVRDVCYNASCLEESTTGCFLNNKLERGYECHCKRGYKGVNCEEDLDECEEGAFCEHGGTCVNLSPGYMCKCRPGYTGVFCEKNINECESNPCKNGATCLDHVGRFVCICKSGFEGKFCDKIVSPCYPEPCLEDIRKSSPLCEDGKSCEAVRVPEGEDMVLILLVEPVEFVKRAEVFLRLVEESAPGIKVSIKRHPVLKKPMVYSWSSLSGQGYLFEDGKPASDATGNGTLVWLEVEFHECADCFTSLKTVVSRFNNETVKESLSKVGLPVYSAQVETFREEADPEETSWKAYVLYSVIAVTAFLALIILIGVFKRKQKIVVTNWFPESMMPNLDIEKTCSLQTVSSAISNFSSGESLLISAVKHGKVETVRALLRNGVDTNEFDDNGRTPLHHAVSICNVELVKLLLSSSNTRVDVADKWGMTPLILTAVESTGGMDSGTSTAIVDCLLSHGANVSAKDSEGRMAIHYAAMNNSAAILESLLIKNPSLVDSQDSVLGQTALHLASRENAVDSVELLLRFGALVGVRDQLERTAENVARTRSHSEIITLLSTYSMVQSHAHVPARKQKRKRGYDNTLPGIPTKLLRIQPAPPQLQFAVIPTIQSPVYVTSAPYMLGSAPHLSYSYSTQ